MVNTVQVDWAQEREVLHRVATQENYESYLRAEIEKAKELETPEMLKEKKEAKDWVPKGRV